MATPVQAENVKALDDLLSDRGESQKDLWVFAEEAIDYITKVDVKGNPQFQVVSGQLRLPGQDFVINYGGQDIMVIDGSKIVDDKGNNVTDLSGGQKYNASKVSTVAPGQKSNAQIRLYIENVQLGGGGVNMMRALSQHSKSLRKLYTSLHVDPGHFEVPSELELIAGKYSANRTGQGFRQSYEEIQAFIDRHILEGVLIRMGVEDKLIYVSSTGGNEVRNLVVYDVLDQTGGSVIRDKIIIRGTTITSPQVTGKNTSVAENIGTIVINSTTSQPVFDEAVTQYNSSRATGNNNNNLGIICLTEKMDKLYQRAQTETISNGFIPIFNEAELLKYGCPTTNKGLYKYGIQLREIFEALKEVWKQQGDKHSRIYATLGTYGCIGVDENGEIYRTSIFKLTGTDTNTNGAGDTFASMVARQEHERRHHGKDRNILEVMILASGTAAYLIENQNAGRTLTETNLKNYMAGKEVQYEHLGNINSQNGTWQGKLAEHPIGPKYEKITMR